jgi:alpha-1,4-digalacturonate transport system substrate-binding protein
MKKLLVLLLCATVSFSVFANGSSEKGSPADEPKTIEILLSDDSLEGGAMSALVDKWNNTHDEFKVKLNEIAYGDIKTQLMNRASIGELPALGRTTKINSYTDFLLPLDDIGFTQDDFVRNGTRNGELLATPINSTAVGLIINKTAFDQAGVAYPLTEADRWTWDEFLVALDKVVANSDVDYGLVIDHSAQRNRTILYQFGMQIFDPNDVTKIAADSPEALEGMNFILDLYKNGYSPASIGLGTENAQSTFKTGKVAAHLSGNWVLTDYTDNIDSFEWIPVLAPYEKEKATCLGGNFLFGFEGTGDEAEAQQFIKWFYQPENYSEYCAIGNYLPAMKGVDVTYEVKGMDIFNMEINATIDQPNNDEIVKDLHAGESFGNALRDGIDKAIAGELDAQGAIDYYVTQINENFTGMSIK